MINTDYSCNYFIDFNEKLSTYLFSKSNPINDIDVQIVFKNLDYIFPKEQVNSLYVSNGINNNSDDNFLNYLFDEIIENIRYKIYYFKNVYLVHFISGSEFYNSFIDDIENNLQSNVIKHLSFEHIHKNSFCFHYDYKLLLKEIFKRVYSSLEYKLERSQLINEIKRLQHLSIQSEEFSFLKDLIFHLRKTETILKLDLDKVQQKFDLIINNWFVEDSDIDIFKFIINGSLEIRKPITLRKPVQYFYYLLFLLKDFNLITDNRINELISIGIFIHVDSNNINLEAHSNAKHRYKEFDFSNNDNNRSEGCIIDLKNLKNSLSKLVI